MIATRVKALLIEDNPDDALLIQQLLLSDELDERFEVLTETSLQDALRTLKHAEVDVVLLDLHLPDSTGLDTLQRIREQCPHLPLLVLTMTEEAAWGGDAVRMGAQDYLLKSDLAGGVLLRAIHYVIQRKQAELKLQQQHQALETEVQRRTAELQMINEKLGQEIAERRQVEMALRSIGKTTEDHLAELQAILNSMAEGLIISDAEGGFLTMNPAALAIYNFGSIEEAAQSMGEGRGVVRRVYSLDGRALPVEEWPISRVVRGETFSDMQVRVENERTGHTFIASHGGTPVRNGDGDIILTLLTVRDITAQKGLEERHRFLSAIVESSNDAIIGFNLNDQVVSWNKGAEAMFGYTNEEIAGQPSKVIIQTVPVEQTPRTPVFTESISRFEGVGLRKDGRRLDISVTVSPIPDATGALTGMSAVVRDITRSKRTEEALRLSEERFRIALKGTHITVFNQDRDLRYTWIYNPISIHQTLSVRAMPISCNVQTSWMCSWR